VELRQDPVEQYQLQQCTLALCDCCRRRCCCCRRRCCCHCCCRAHYSAGQIYALQGQWPQSEHSYRACAELSPDPPSQAQALYCVGVARHQQGNFAAAVEAYESAGAAGPGDNLQPMLALGTARALSQQGLVQEAAVLAQAMLASQWAGLCAPPVAQALRELAAAGDGQAAASSGGKAGSKAGSGSS
jgi:tetratricopeptide (TPR) repeat protein